jgi:hypothetical protein
MGETSAIFQDIEKFVGRLSPEPVCDDCITERLKLGNPADAAHAAHELAGMGGFERGKCACSLCGETRMTTRRR